MSEKWAFFGCISFFKEILPWEKKAKTKNVGKKKYFFMHACVLSVQSFIIFFKKIFQLLNFLIFFERKIALKNEIDPKKAHFSMMNFI